MCETTGSSTSEEINHVIIGIFQASKDYELEALSHFLIPGVIFLFTLVTGLWLSHTGRPFNGLLFNAHKLIALAAAITAGVQFARLLKLSTPAIAIVLLGAAAVCTLGMFVSGALLSLAKPAPVFVLRIHQVTPVLLLASVLASIWLWISQPL
jgi:hypothetical protein